MSININEFNELAEKRGEALLSIYMPTHTKGKEIRQNHLRLKNLLSDVENRIEQIPHDKRMIRERIAALRPLVDDMTYWRDMSHGLALLVSDAGVVSHRLPMPVEELAVVSDRFIVRPMLPAVSTGERFYLLDLSEKHTRLAACTRDGARVIDDQDIPERVAEVVGWDVQQKSLQFHTEAQPTMQAGHGRAAMFHGQGSGGEEDDNKELEQFLKAVDRGIEQLLDGAQAPLVLAGDERIVAMFKHLTHYGNVVEESVTGNYDHADIDRVYEKALPLAEPALDAANQAQRDRFQEAAHTDAAVAGLSSILPKLRNARIDTLYVDPSHAVWGRFDDAQGEVEVHERRDPADEDLLDLTVANALATGARVVPTRREVLPNGEPVAALLRF